MKRTIATLTENLSTTLDFISKLSEAIRYLSLLPIDKKKVVIKEHIDVMGFHKIGEEVLHSRNNHPAFNYYATSRATYGKLSQDYKLHSIKTLRRLTSRVSKTNDENFIRNNFANLDGEHRWCMILVDEVYVKPSLQYHGGHLFVKAVNQPQMLANTVLAIIVKCLHGGPKFLVKIILVFKITCAFLYDQVTSIINLITNSCDDVVCVIDYNNRTNQGFLNHFDTVDEKPWKTKEGLFLLFK